MKFEINGTVTNKYQRNDGSCTIEITEKTEHHLDGNHVSKIEVNSGHFDLSGVEVLDNLQITGEISGSVSSKGARWLTILDAHPVKK